MELGGFIATTLEQIAKGLRDGDAAISSLGYEGIWTRNIRTLSSDLVNVRILKGEGESDKHSVPLIVVDFEARVVAEESSKAGMDGGVRISVIEFGGTRSSDATQGHQHTIRFSVPISVAPKNASD